MKNVNCENKFASLCLFSLHASTLFGLFLLFISLFSLLSEWIHTVIGHKEHSYGLFAIVFGEQMIVSFYLAAFLTLTIYLFVITKYHQNKMTWITFYLDVYPISLAVCFACIICIFLYVYLRDLIQVEGMFYFPLAILLDVITLGLGFVALLLFHIIKRKMYLICFFLFPGLFSLALSLLARYLRYETVLLGYGEYDVPIIYPVLSRVIIILLFAFLFLIILNAILQRILHIEGTFEVSLFFTGLCSWVFSCLVCYGFFIPFHHLCSHSLFVSTQDKAMTLLIVLFIITRSFIFTKQYSNYAKQTEIDDFKMSTFFKVGAFLPKSFDPIDFINRQNLEPNRLLSKGSTWISAILISLFFCTLTPILCIWKDFFSGETYIEQYFELWRYSWIWQLLVCLLLARFFYFSWVLIKAKWKTNNQIYWITEWKFDFICIMFLFFSWLIAVNYH